MKDQVNIALMGFGVVGSGTMQLLKQHKKDIESRVGASVSVKWIVSRHKKHSKWIGPGVKQTRRWRDVIADPKVDCVVELIGGIEPAKQIVVSAIKSGKHVVTANKALLSKHWNEIFNSALKNRKLVYFEASVGGGVPIIQALNEGLAGNEIQKIEGILNGTSNYILTQMQERGIDFSTALKEAKEAGFAEADPTFDLDGTDAAQKISILGSLATGNWISPSRVYKEGIQDLKNIDIRFLQEKLHSTVKLLGIAESTPAGWIFRVHPTLVSRSHPFANVRNEYNAVSLHGNAVKDVMLYGKGAGRLPTASAVVSDIMFLCRQIANGTAGQIPYVSRHHHRKVRLASMDKVRTKYYLRVNTKDKPGVLSRVTGILGRFGVSLASVHQDTFEESHSQKGVPIILLTHESQEQKVQASVKAINRMPTTVSKTVLLRMA